MPRALRFAFPLIVGLAVPGLARAQMANMAGAPDTAQLSRVRTALDKYKDPYAAVRDGYFSTLACIDFPRAGGEGAMAYRAGAMGVHFLNPALIGPQLDTLRPTVLIYEPVHDTLRLVAAEWLMPTQVSPTRPRIFGRDMDGPMEGHAPVMPAELHHWDLHVWLWKDNPAGVFHPTNAAVHCPNGRYTVREDAPHMVMP